MMKSTICGLMLAAAFPLSAAADSLRFTPVDYSCGSNGDVLRTLMVSDKRKSDADYVILLQMDEMIVLRKTRSASGASYRSVDPNYTYVLQTKGDAAYLTEGNDRPVMTDCWAD